MSKQRPPAFQLYARDFLAGTTNMSACACGAYIRFLCHAWDGNPICSIPADDYSLYKLSGCDSKEEWNTIKAMVLAKFRAVEIEGVKRLVNDRLMEYWKELAGFSETKSKAAHARWDKKKGDAGA
jgi:uncharacterized protein YdaU (DUF1376 family)